MSNEPGTTRNQMISTPNAAADASRTPDTESATWLVGCSGEVDTFRYRPGLRSPLGTWLRRFGGSTRPGAALDPGQALRGFLDALGVPATRIPEDLATRTGLFRSLLAGKRVLVVLDNARSAEQVRPLLPGSPGCLAVVTSSQAWSPPMATARRHRPTVALWLWRRRPDGDRRRHLSHRALGGPADRD
jgi:hypothetical protein